MSKRQVFRSIAIILCCLAMFGKRSLAQAPMITSNIGMPIGTAPATGVAYGNGVYVCTLGAGSIYTSADGSTWTKVTDPGIPAQNLTRLAFGAGVFVASGYNGTIITSTDGLHWTSQTSHTTENLYDVEFLQGRFYMLGYHSTLLTSDDGTNWSAVTFGAGTSNDLLMNITYGNGTFVIGARNGNNYMTYLYTSSTGDNNSWSYTLLGAVTVNRVQYLKDRFYLTTAETNIFTSTDAITWTDNTTSFVVHLPDGSTTGIGTPSQVFHGIYDGNKIYFYGYSRYYNSYGAIYSSTDGINFTLQPITAYIVCQGAAFINNKYFCYGNEGIITSNDGINYTYPGGSYNAIASSGTGYVGVGAIGQAGVIYTSPDFSTWTSKTPAVQNALTGIVYTGSEYVAAGDRTVVSSTDNGSTWSALSSPQFYFTSLAYNNNLFTGVGSETVNNKAQIVSSADGINWNVVNTDNNYYFKVKAVNNEWFALGYNNVSYLGVVMHSSDGTNWTDITPNLSFQVYDFNDVIYDGTNYIFTGVDYAIYDPANNKYTANAFFSISTATPADPNSYGNKGTIVSPPSGAFLASPFGEGSFAYSNGNYIGTVNDYNNYETYLIYSSDGVTWNQTDLNTSSVINGILPEGDSFRMLGSGDLKLTATFPSVTLPVRMIRFDANLVNHQTMLKWQTATETDALSFTIQHRTDATKWSNIGIVQAHGNSSSENSYAFIHVNPATGNNYYRLVETDINGKQQISDIRQVQMNQLNGVHIFPNPAHDLVNIQVPGMQSSTVQLYNAAGQMVYQQIFTSSLQLPLANLPKGNYQLIITYNGNKLTRQISHQ